jgi:hypothetical protein
VRLGLSQVKGGVRSSIWLGGHFAQLGVVDMGLSRQSSGCDGGQKLMEWLLGIVAHPILGSHHISVQHLLRSPACSIEEEGVPEVAAAIVGFGAVADGVEEIGVSAADEGADVGFGKGLGRLIGPAGGRRDGGGLELRARRRTRIWG